MKSQIKFYRSLGAKLVQARTDLGKEQSEVAKHITKTQSYVSKIENGDIKIDLYTLDLLAKFYKKPIQYFIKENE